MALDEGALMNAAFVMPRGDDLLRDSALANKNPNVAREERRRSVHHK